MSVSGFEWMMAPSQYVARTMRLCGLFELLRHTCYRAHCLDEIQKSKDVLLRNYILRA